MALGTRREGGGGRRGKEEEEEFEEKMEDAEDYYECTHYVHYECTHYIPVSSPDTPLSHPS